MGEKGESLRSQAADPGRSSGHRSQSEAESGSGLAARSFRFVVLPIVGVALLLLVGAVASKPLYAALKVRKARNMARTATAHFATNDFIGGWKSLQLAIQFAPADPGILQLRAEILTRIRDPRAIAEWYQLASVRPLTPDESWQLVDLALLIERLDVAGTELRKLGALRGREAAFLRRQTRFDILTGATDDAIAHARNLAELDTGNIRSELLLGEALISSSNGLEIAEGQRVLILLAQTEPTVQLEAITLLLDHGTLSPSERNQLARVLNSRPDLDLTGQILSASLRMTTDRRQREDSAEEVRSHLPAKDETAAIRFTDWCLRFQIPDAAVAAIRPFATGTNQDSVNLYLQSVALSEDWAALEELLKEGNPRFDPAIIETVRGWHSAKIGKPDEAGAHFRVAITKAQATATMPSRNSLVATWAERAGLPLLAVEAYAPLLQFPPTTVFAARSSLKLLVNHPELAPTLPVLRSLLEYAPNDGAIQFEFAHTALVLNKDIPKAAVLAAELHRQLPKSPLTRLLAAAARTRSGNPAEGLAFLDDNPIDSSQLDDRWRALEVFVLAQAKQHEPARRLARKINRDSLRIEERAFLDLAQ